MKKFIIQVGTSFIFCIAGNIHNFVFGALVFALGFYIWDHYFELKHAN